MKAAPLALLLELLLSPASPALPLAMDTAPVCVGPVCSWMAPVSPDQQRRQRRGAAPRFCQQRLLLWRQWQGTHPHFRQQRQGRARPLCRKLSQLRG